MLFKLCSDYHMSMNGAYLCILNLSAACLGSKPLRYRIVSIFASFASWLVAATIIGSVLSLTHKRWVESVDILRKDLQLIFLP